MINSIKQWSLAALALALAWPLSSWMRAALRGSDGSLGVPILSAASPASAVLPLAAGLLVFSLLAWISARLTHRYFGPVIFGLCLAVLAHRSVSVDTFLRMTSDQPAYAAGFRPLYLRFAAEVFIWWIPAAALTFLCAKTTPSRYPHEHGWKSPDSFSAAALSMILAIGLSWLFVRTESRDQSLGGVTAAGALALMVSRMIWSNANATSLIMLVSLTAGLVGTLSSAFTLGPSPLDAMARGDLWPMARPLPLDWVAGALLGSSLGVGLARSFGEVDEPDQRSLPPARTA